MQYGPYLLLERISVGGMAEVYKAKEYGVEGFERTVAVKRILPHVAEDEEFIAMFKDEAKIAVQLNHGNIAQIYNLGNEQDSFYIALEYINGRDLRAVFQKCQQQGKPMPISQACYVIMKICEGLDYAHNKKDKYQRELNIIHRDVSPPNILVSFEGEVKLIDFGVAKAAGRASRTQAGILKGKFGYMSPEQVRGMPLDRRSDVFSVGVVLFEMLTGTRLFQADTDFATLEKVRAVEVPRPSSLNPEINKPLENIIYKALAREPEQRYQSAIELHDELQAFMFAQGLFYSRKDLAGWMRHQYAREIELEKEKDKAQAIAQARADGEVPPPPAPKRKTMVMSNGGGPPPPPPRKAAGAPAPPPPPRAAGEASGPSRKVKRKTMVMTTARPNLPVPPGAGPPKPKPRSKSNDGGDPPTVPIGTHQALPKPKSMPANPRPKPKAKSTLSYAAASAPPSSDFDWDDDELETRLFEGEGDASLEGVGGARTPMARESAEVGGAIAAPAQGADAHAANQPHRSVTIVPPGGHQSAAPPASVDDAVARGLTVVPGMMQGPAPATQPAMQQHMPMPGYPQHMGQVMPGATQAHPAIAHSGVDYDDRSTGKSGTGALLGIVAIVVVVVGIAAGLGFMIMTGRLGGGSGGEQVAEATKTESGEAQSDKPASGAALATLTVQTTPRDAKVTVGDRVADGESPFIVSGLEPGKHKLVVSSDGYLPFEREIDVPASGLSFPAPPLERKDVTLVLDSDPPGASMNLLVDGKAVAMGTSGSQHKLSREPGSTYEVEASLKGYVTAKVPLRFSGEESQPVRVTLVRDQTVADASVTSSTTDTPSRPSPKPSPSSTSTRSKPKPTPPAPKPAPAAAKTATLKIGTNPGVPPAKVSIDGTPVGTTPLFQGVKVAPGSRKVKFEWTDRAAVTQTVNVGDNETKIVKGG